MFRSSEDNRAHAASTEGGSNSDDLQAALDIWARVKRRLRAELGEDVFASWFGRLELEAMVGGCAHLTVPTRFLKSWIEAHYVDRVLAVYRMEVPEVERVTIGVRNTLGRDPAAVARRMSEAPRPSVAGAPAPGAFPVGEQKPAAVLPVEERTDASELGGAPLDPRLTFESFIIGRSNALAHAAADRVARHQGAQALYNPLFLHAGRTFCTPSGTRRGRRGVA
jgi:chromosomal replication initiator protein